VTELAGIADDVFCMRCGPGAALDADPAARRLRRARCGEETRLPGLPLFVVTGASGAGKTTITQPLRRLLPECAVFEADAILSMAAIGWDAWRSTWLMVAREVALGGRATVLTGSLTPDQLSRLPARKLVGPLYFANLDCSDDVLAERLRARPAWRGTSSDAKVAEHQRFAAWLRAGIDPSFDTSVLTIGEVAEQVAGWVRGRLDAPDGGLGPEEPGR
jgi:hypothetical protein